MTIETIDKIREDSIAQAVMMERSAVGLDIVEMVRDVSAGQAEIATAVTRAIVRGFEVCENMDDVAKCIAQLRAATWSEE